jgi:hypothetical protein
MAKIFAKYKYWVHGYLSLQIPVPVSIIKVFHRRRNIGTFCKLVERATFTIQKKIVFKPYNSSCWAEDVTQQ